MSCAPAIKSPPALCVIYRPFLPASVLVGGFDPPQLLTGIQVVPLVDGHPCFDENGSQEHAFVALGVSDQS
jgi:hypothetical protein